MTVDLDAIKAKWLGQCGACDAGIGMCTHPEEDYRPVMLDLVREVERLRELLAPERIGADHAMVALDSPDVVNVLVQHQRKDITGCICGWSRLGHSHAVHVLGEIVVVVRELMSREFETRTRRRQ